MNMYNPDLKDRTWVISERHQVQNNERSLINKPRYTICGKCKKPVIKMIAQGYMRGHQNIPIGYFCRWCKTLFCEDKIAFVSYSSQQVNSKVDKQ